MAPILFDGHPGWHYFDGQYIYHMETKPVLIVYNGKRRFYIDDDGNFFMATILFDGHPA